MSPDPSSTGAGGHTEWLRVGILAASCLAIGFVGGWALRGDSGGGIVVPPANPGTPTATTPAPPPVVTPPPAPAAPPRAEVAVAVLNGTDITGLAARTATRAGERGYVDVVTGNAPTATGPSVVYHRAGAAAAARRAAGDLGISEVLPLPASGAIAEAAPAESDVIVVLGSG